MTRPDPTRRRDALLMLLDLPLSSHARRILIREELAGEPGQEESTADLWGLSLTPHGRSVAWLDLAERLGQGRVRSDRHDLPLTDQELKEMHSLREGLAHWMQLEARAALHGQDEVSLVSGAIAVTSCKECDQNLLPEEVVYVNEVPYHPGCAALIPMESHEDRRQPG